MPRSVSDVNSHPERSLQFPLSRTILQSRSGLESNIKDSDPKKQLLSERLKKADKPSVPISMLEHQEDINAIFFDGNDKMPGNSFKDLFDRN